MNSPVLEISVWKIAEKARSGKHSGKGAGMNRRQFFRKAGKAGAAAVLGSVAGGIFAGRASAGEWEQGAVEHWDSGLFRQDNVDIGLEAEGIVRARIDGEWLEFPRTPLPQGFLDWNLNARIDMLASIGDLMRGGGGEGPSLAGPHNAAMATTSARRRDSMLVINNAFKGIGMCPTRDKVKDLIQHMRDTVEAPMPEKLGTLTSLYADSGNFDHTRLITLELYATPNFETHTFLNLMENPATSLVYLDSVSYEVRGIAELVHPENADASEYSRDLVTYTNLAHSYFHGEFPRLFPGIIVHVVEVFDNSPGSGLGVRVAPATV